MNDPKFATLLGWIRAKPALAGVRIDGDDRRIVRIVARGYGTAEKAILALDPSTLEGLDASGGIVRTYTVKDAVTTMTETSSSSSSRASKESWPEGATSELAQVIALACDRAAERHEKAYRMAFDKIADLYQEQSRRLSELERSHYNAMELRVQQAEQLAEDIAAERDALLEEKNKAPSVTQASGADALVGEVIGHVVTKALTEPAQTNGAAK